MSDTFHPTLLDAAIYMFDIRSPLDQHAAQTASVPYNKNKPRWLSKCIQTVAQNGNCLLPCIVVLVGSENRGMSKR